MRHLGRSHAQRKQNQKNRDDQPHQHEVLLTLAFHLHATP
jgi:hypothetical protein